MNWHQLSLGLDLDSGGGWVGVELTPSLLWAHSGGRNPEKTEIIMVITCLLLVIGVREDMYPNSGL